MFTAPPFDGSSNELCDWMELNVLGSGRRRAPLGDVNLEIEIEEESESDDLAKGDQLRELRVQKVVQAVDERVSSTLGRYPFFVDGQSLVLHDDITVAGAVYIFCLIVSNAAPGGILEGDGLWRPDLPTARKLFQACATVSAAGYATGPAYSVGAPRADGSSFLDKLKEVYSDFGDGKPHTSKPAHAPPHAKDDGIDVIAWRYEPDGLAGSLYLLLQSASGADWPDKSIKDVVETFHATWFTQPPASVATAGLAMPFFLPSRSDADADDHESQERILGQFWRTVKEMGVVLYRNRITRYVQDGLGCADTGLYKVESVQSLNDVQTYVEKYCVQLQDAVEALR